MRLEFGGDGRGGERNMQVGDAYIHMLVIGCDLTSRSRVVRVEK